MSVQAIFFLLLLGALTGRFYNLLGIALASAFLVVAIIVLNIAGWKDIGILAMIGSLAILQVGYVIGATISLWASALLSRLSSTARKRAERK